MLEGSVFDVRNLEHVRAHLLLLKALQAPISPLKFGHSPSKSTQHSLVTAWSGTAMLCGSELFTEHRTSDCFHVSKPTKIITHQTLLPDISETQELIIVRSCCLLACAPWFRASWSRTTMACMNWVQSELASRARSF